MIAVALLPLSLYRVKYQVARGRPYSVVERLILEAIGAGIDCDGKSIDSVERLAAYFRVHPRIATEVLVTLTHAGWVAVAGSQAGGFVLTAEGRAALATVELPPEHLISAEKPATVVLDRVAGLLASSDEVQYSHKGRLEKLQLDGGSVWEQAVRLRPTYLAYVLDAGEVQRFLPRPQGSWLERIGEIQRMSTAHWAAVQVNLDQERIDNLPAAWADTLRQPVLDAVKRESRLARSTLRFPRGLESRAAEASRDRNDNAAEWLAPSDVLTRAASHDSLLERALTSSTGPIFVASAFLTPQRIDLLEPWFATALAMGRKIDLLWGYDDAGGRGVARLKKLRADHNAKQTLRFNEAASGSHAKLLIWQEDGCFSAAVGSANWLSASGTDPDRLLSELTVVVRSPRLVARLARCAAGLSQDLTPGQMSAVPWHWSEVASALEERAHLAPWATERRGEAACSVSVVRDTEHESLMRSLLRHAQRRVLVASHRVGPVGPDRLVPLTVARTSGAPQIRAVIGQRASEIADHMLLEQTVKNLGGQLEIRPRFHAKALVADDESIVGSYNFLSADPWQTSARTRELSLRIEGADATALLWDAVAPA